ncbi:flp operon protein C [Lonepinella sp. MS14435]|uniref:flp operon protein C n=1 Tax=Lonepinella sp. MS14435 TaxID=3003618 RepID=UPI0036DE7DB1
MNYRILFFISFLILAVGLGGLFLIPSSNESDSDVGLENQTTEIKEQGKEQKLITTAVLTRNVTKGSLLQAEDYTLSDLTVDIDSPLVDKDVKSWIDNSANHSLQGFLMSENLTKDSFLSKDNIISPDDTRFLLSSVDGKREVAYRIYVKPEDAYLLDTVLAGGSVSIFGQQTAKGFDSADRNELIKVIDNVLVLYTKKFSDNEIQRSDSKDFAGYITVKVEADQVQNAYSVAKESKLIVLPTNTEASTINHRGMFIRKLRGQ